MEPLGGGRAVSARAPSVTVPVLDAGADLHGLVGVQVAELRGLPCDGLSRCSVAFVGLDAGGKAKGPAPLPMPGELCALMGGSWVRVLSWLWSPADWSSIGAVWWSGGLCEGFGVFARVRKEDAGALQLAVNVSLLVDRGGAETGGKVGPGMVIL